MANDLLRLCARTTRFPGLLERLTVAAAEVTDWDALLHLADAQGVAPLVHWHLQDMHGVCPDQFRRGARLLFLRHQHVNALYYRVLEEVVALFREAGIPVLVLKGGALCRTVYPDKGLRPMRDMDLLVPPDRAWEAQNLLVASGFAASSAPRPEDHFHLPSLQRKTEGLMVCIELHHGFFPNCPPYYRKQDFYELLERAIPFALTTGQALTLAHEDMLWHVFDHGIRMPLAYEPLKLISVADIISLVEEKFDEINWEVMREKYPEVVAGLPMLHHLSPWQDKVRSVLFPGTPGPPEGVGETFAGWPRHRLKELRGNRPFALLRATFWPSEWWCRLYYGPDSWWGYLRCRWLTHPLHVFWWVRLQASFLVPGQMMKEKPTFGQRIRRLWIGTSALFNKFFK